MRAILGMLLVLFASWSSASAGVLSGTTITVTTTQDELIQDGDCSLREAVRSANLNTPVDACPAGSGMDIILLDKGLYLLNTPGTGEDDAVSGDLDIREGVIILGKDMTGTIIDGNHLDRVFHVFISSSFALQKSADPSTRPVTRLRTYALDSTVRLAKLTIQNGQAPGGEAEYYGGGGILNMGSTLEVNRVVFSGNQAARTGGGIDNVASTALLSQVLFTANSSENGGGIFNDGTLNLNRVTLFGNSATNRGGGMDTQYDATLINVTISGNSAGQFGGGLFTDKFVMFLNSTIVENNTGVANRGGIRFKSTIVANNQGGNCTDTGAFTSDGNNLDSDGSCNFHSPTDQSGIQPLLGPIQDNGGGIQTQALQPGSPAIDKGNDLDCPATDGRGARRPADGDGSGPATCDIGAFELNGSFYSGVYLPLIVP